MRMAKGLTIPKRTTEGTKSTTQAKNEPRTAPTEAESIPLMVTFKKRLGGERDDCRQNGPAQYHYA